MDQAAAEILAGGSTDRTTMGLFPTADVERLPDGVEVFVEGSGFQCRNTDQPGMERKPGVSWWMPPKS